ncbi:hypothetical protein LguiA_015065 [Lonicera macranthoides]
MKRNHENPSTCFLFFLFLISFSLDCSAANTIRHGQLIRDGETIISSGGNFALGFFSPGDSLFRYVGIWYNKIPQPPVIWVANRDIPVTGSGGILTIQDDGNLVVLNGNGNSVWSSNASSLADNSLNNSTAAILKDTGDLILSIGENIGDDISRALWRSFDNPTDTYLPGMRVKVNSQDGENRAFSSWRSANDPSPGSFSMGVDPRGSPQIVIWEGLNRRWRSGHWNGIMFIGVPHIRATYLYGFGLDEVGNDKYFTYTLSNTSDLIRFLIRWDGVEEQFRWDEGRREWNLIQSQPANECEFYNKCGAFGKCSASDSPICSCLEGFVPNFLDQWNNGNWSGGCVRRTELECERRNGSSIEEEGVEEDGFLKVEGVKLPDYVDWIGSEDLEDCKTKCLRNCSCTAYACVSGINCMIWSGDLVDVEQFEDGRNNLYIRLAHSELAILYPWRKNNETPQFVAGKSREYSTDFSGTDDLSVEGKQGSGSGTELEGTLPGDQEIAVKRLSRKSGQGIEEFKNEITLIAKLQHRNLVRLLGCCIEGEEKMLLYEYMPNKSLDSYIFDSTKQAQLNWKNRFAIIGGIARGLLYLHRDSRLRIIHRDLKASNILLDEEMNPKISDFGMARIFGGNQNEANTNRIVGTYGYMAPEYAMEGLFSVKSDVYSFGVLLLEIISGRKNTSYRSPEYSNIIGYAWDLWERGRAMELVDPCIAKSCSREEVLKCIHVGMLCVQDLAAHRPNMSAVVLMLESESATLPLARQPTFTSMRSFAGGDSENESHDIVSSNNVTISVILGR